MSSEWPIVLFGDAPLAIMDGDRGTNYPSQDDFSSTGHCLFLNTANVTTDGFKFLSCMFISVEKDAALRKGKLVRGDVVLTTRGTVGNVGFYHNDVNFDHVRINSGMVILRSDQERLSSYFLSLFLRSNLFKEQVKSLQSGSAQPQLPIRDMKRIEIPLPDIKEQVNICNVLGALDDRIALLRETNATLEAIAQALFKSWFVDFDPVHAKHALSQVEGAQGLAPEGMDEAILARGTPVGAPGVPPDPSAAAALFPDSFEESELGLVPKGWRWSTLNDAYEINPQRKLKKGEIAPYLDMANAPISGHGVDSVIKREMGSGSKFVNGDTLLARITPCLENGKTAFVDFLEDDQIGWGSTEFVVLHPKKPLPEYHAYLLARHKPFRDFSIQSMSGTSGRQRIQNEVLGHYLVALPTEKVATAFGNIVTPIQQRITANNAQAQTLATLRDTLLPRLISGQLRLPEAGENHA